MPLNRKRDGHYEHEPSTLRASVSQIKHASNIATKAWAVLGSGNEVFLNLNLNFVSQDTSKQT